ncbi:MAG TPA: rhomboid family intramembrane serine protease [Pirellulales bacterium]|jgi:GlpG protein|nr:rhomboid family intramembrane serine protease [Pirellulales bacterium]
MRQAGTLSNRDQAQCLVDYLLTQGVQARIDPNGDAWVLWVRDEDQLPQAVRELQEFQANPLAPRYQQAAASAANVRKQQARDDHERRKNLIEVRNRWDVRPTGRKALTILLIVLCVLVAIATDAGEKQDSPVLDYLFFAPPPRTFLEQFNWSPIQAIAHGQIWRLVTPIFIHFGPMHLVFNMYMFYLFGSIIEVRRGTLRFGLLVLVVAVTANFAQYYFPFRLHWGGLPTTNFGGMSGVVFGLLGYIWMKSRFEPQLQMYVSDGTVLFLVVWLVLGWTGALNQLVGGSIANWEHTVGFLVGMVIGYAPVAWRKLTGMQ